MEFKHRRGTHLLHSVFAVDISSSVVCGGVDPLISTLSPPRFARHSSALPPDPRIMTEQRIIVIVVYVNAFKVVRLQARDFDFNRRGPAAPCYLLLLHHTDTLILQDLGSATSQVANLQRNLF